MKRLVPLAVAVVVSMWGASPAWGQEAGSPAPKPPAPYTPPFQLRPAAVGNALRLETTTAGYGTPTGRSTTLIMFLGGSYKLAPHWGLFGKIGLADLVHGTVTGTAVTNAVVGAAYATASGPWKLSAATGVVLPLAAGGGDSPDPSTRAAIGSGSNARMAMEGALFGPNDLSAMVGMDAAWVKARFTVQLEATVIEAFRVRAADKQPDAYKTNSTYGLHVGYFLTPHLSVGSELRYQRFLSTPAAVAADPTGSLRDTLSLGIGARAHFAYRGIVLRPGISYSFGLDDPLASRGYHVFGFDVIASL